MIKIQRHVVDATYVICMYMYGTNLCTGEDWVTGAQHCMWCSRRRHAQCEYMPIRGRQMTVPTTKVH